MVEIHDLQLSLVTSNDIHHNTALRFKQIHLHTAIFTLFWSGYDENGNMKITNNN